ncbi:MAG: YadA C-terminal domain-containing protein [Fusobacterium sp.]|nr:YadA C-terminal domain-containing protein [Fusobacterium sp.]
MGSLSTALSALHPLQYDKNKPNQIMAGFGQYRDKSAVAVGMAHYFTENLMMTGGVSLSEGSNTKAMANVGLTWKFGKGGNESTSTPSYVMQNELRRLTLENLE